MNKFVSRQKNKDVNFVPLPCIEKMDALRNTNYRACRILYDIF